MTDLLRISPTAFTASGGKFRVDRRYLRIGNSASSFPVPKGKTLSIKSRAFGKFPSVRYSVNGYTEFQTHVWGGETKDDPAPAGSFNASFTMVRTE